MKKLIIILAIIACATIAQAQDYGNERRSSRDLLNSYPYNSEPTPMPQYNTPYPENYFSIQPNTVMQYQDPVPVYREPLMRDYPARPYVDYLQYK